MKICGRHFCLLLLLSFAACASPQLDCQQFPRFQANTTMAQPSDNADRRRILGEAAAMPDADALALVRGYVALGDLDSAGAVIASDQYFQNRSEAEDYLIEASIRTGDVEGTRSLVNAFTAARFERLIVMQLARAHARSGDAEKAMAVLDEMPARAEGRRSIASLHLAFLAEDLAAAGFLEAAHELARLMESEPFLLRASVLLSIARQELADGDAESARITLESAVEEINSSSEVVQLNKYPLLQGIAATYLLLGDQATAESMLNRVVQHYSGPGGTFQTAQLLAVLKMQLELDDPGTSNDTASQLFTRYTAGHGGWQANRFELSALVGMVLALFAEGRSDLAYDALNSAEGIYARSVLSIAIAVGEARFDQADRGIARARALEDEDAACSSIAGISVALASVGKTERALALADTLDPGCLRQNRFVPSTGWSEVGGDEAGPFPTIALMSSYYGDERSMCRALNKVPDGRIWEDTLAEIAVVGAARGDLRGAEDLVQYARSIRPIGSTGQSGIYSRMISQEPPAWSPEQFGMIEPPRVVFRTGI